MIVTKNKLACADFAFPLLAHDKVLELIKMMEFDGVDIGLFEGRSHLRPSAVLDHPVKNGERLRQTVADRGLEIADVFLQTDLDFKVSAVNHPAMETRKKTEEIFKRFMDYACGCGCGHITCLPGVWFPEEDYEDSLARAADALGRRVEMASQKGLVLGVEAHIGSIADTPHKAFKLLEATKGLTLTLDYSHFAFAGIPDSAVHPLVKYASHFHLRGAARGQLQSRMDENKIDYASVFRKMEEEGYEEYIGIEYTWTEWENCNRTDNVSESILARDLVRNG